jgi:hypothetical protein
MLTPRIVKVLRQPLTDMFECMGVHAKHLQAVFRAPPVRAWR